MEAQLSEAIPQNNRTRVISRLRSTRRRSKTAAARPTAS